MKTKKGHWYGYLLKTKKMWCCIRCLFKAFIAIFLCFASYNSGIAQNRNSSEYDFANIFGDRYREAEAFFDKEYRIDDSLKSFGVNPDFARAIVFPELIRFSAIQNIIEVNSLKVLYVQFGNQYADFSVGFFQIKPSFAEQIENDVKFLAESDELNPLKFNFPATGTETEIRKERIERLDKLDWQVRYLATFIKIMDHLNSAKRFTDTEKLRYYATAYNCGYWKGENHIRAEMNKKRFHTELFNAEAKYNYADVSVDFYLNHKGKKH